MSTNGISLEQTSTIATKALGKNVVKNGGVNKVQQSLKGQQKVNHKVGRKWEKR